jgi:hypothetical protein
LARLPWVCAALAVVASAACGGPPAPTYRPIADVKQLMQGIVDPSADGVWESVSVIFTKAGMEERRPRTDKEWAAVRPGEPTGYHWGLPIAVRVLVAGAARRPKEAICV